MSTTKATSIALPPRRVFGSEGSALEDEDIPEQSTARRILGRVSFGNSQHRPSFAARWRSVVTNDGDVDGTPTERPAIPTMMQSPGEAYTTPLPVLSMIVLSITMLGEFLSANVSTPFLLFMVKDFGELTTEADIAFWTGILVSTFFMTQFLTSLLWATVAEKHGRRAVLVISLLGSAVTCLIFGIFAGAVGVARGSVAFVTDPSNEGRAYAILGFCWGFGGVAGAVIGGAFESPAVKWPGVFSGIPLFVRFPYILPCGLAACITLTGSLLGCFLNRDGGPREGAIHLLPEKINVHPAIPEDESVPPSPLVFEEPDNTGFVGSIGRRVSQRLSGYFAQRVPDAHATHSSTLPESASTIVPMSVPRTSRAFSRTNGSAYGYTASYRNRLASNATTLRRGSVSSAMRRRESTVDGHRRDSTTDGGSELNFAQRLLMANENAVTNIADLWVAAAINVDNEDPFVSDSETESDDERDDIVDGAEERDPTTTSPLMTPKLSRVGSRVVSNSQSRRTSRRTSNSSMGLRASQLASPRIPSAFQNIPSLHRTSSFQQPLEGSPTSRRFSTVNTIPAIFQHPGVRTPPAVLDAQQIFAREIGSEGGDALQPILESRRTSQFHSRGTGTQEGEDADIEAMVEKPPSLSSQLPILVIIQYGLMALHTTTHDQVFMSYLVSPYESGGLNLNAGHFAQLIAMMCLASIAYQFYLYPNVGPPRGRFSHLAMFRLGNLLFIPAYLTVILYRPFASAEEDGNFILMTALALSTAVRYCGSTFGYTAIAILLNYMTPPNAVGYANGIAQSIVSLARCFGPVLGGYLWSVSVQDHPEGYPLGFIACAGFCAISVLQSFMIR